MASGYIAVIGGMILISEGVHQAFAYVGMLVVPSLCLPLIWLKKKKKFLIIWLIPAVIYFVSLGVHYREETVVRSVRDGSILDRYPGDIRIMPNGEKWKLK